MADSTPERNVLEERHWVNNFLEPFKRLHPDATTIEKAECIIFQIDTTPLQWIRTSPALREIVLKCADALRQFITRGETILATSRQIYTDATDEAIRLNQFAERLSHLDACQAEVQELESILESAAKTLEYVEGI